MACLFQHDWGWPRRRGDQHLQVCIRCGMERESRVQFDGPRYRRTQDAGAAAEALRKGVAEQAPLPFVA